MKHLHVVLLGWTTSIASTLDQNMLNFTVNQVCFTAESVDFISGGVLGK